MTPDDLTLEARTARAASEHQARRLARRACWRAADGDPDRFRTLMALWLGITLDDAPAPDAHPNAT